MKRIFVQFGVDVGGLKEAMAEHVRNLFEADSAPDHSCCAVCLKECALSPRIEIPARLRWRFGDATHCTEASNWAERCASA